MFERAYPVWGAPLLQPPHSKRQSWPASFQDTTLGLEALTSNLTIFHILEVGDLSQWVKGSLCNSGMLSSSPRIPVEENTLRKVAL